MTNFRQRMKAFCDALNAVNAEDSAGQRGDVHV